LHYSPEYKIQDVHLAAILDFGCWFSKGTFPYSEAQPTKKISSQSANPFLHYSPEYKIQDVHLVAILDFGWHWFSKGIFR
jgi:hypothetical protein